MHDGVEHGQKKNDHYVKLALSGIPKNFRGRMPKVSVGTGILSMPVYETMPNAEHGEKAGDIICKFVHPGGIIEVKGIMINAVPAYNRLKPFHTNLKVG